MIKALNILKSYMIFILVVVALLLSPAAGNFLKMNNLMNILRVGALLAIISCAQAVVKLVSPDGIDLSIGGIMSFAAYVGAMLVLQGYTVLGIGVSILIGTLSGLFNGVLVSYVKLPPFAATFGTSNIFRALACLVANGIVLYDFPDAFRFIGTGYILGIPTLIYIMVILVGLMFFLMRYTNMGRNIYCVGSNKIACSICGINYKRMVALAYTLSGFLSGIVAILYVARLNAAETSFGTEFPLQTVTACILAGIYAGKGNIIDCVIGAYTITIISNGMTLLAIPSTWQDFVYGAVLLVGLLMTYLVQRVEDSTVEKQLKGASLQQA